MPIDQNQLDALVKAADAATGSSPAADAALAATLSTPTKAPKVERVTYTSLAGVWGTATAAAFKVAMAQAIAVGQQQGATTQQQQFGALAAFIDTLLQGPGIDPSNSEVPAQSAAFVAAGLATQQQVDGVFYDVAYPAGGEVQTSDVTASRARLALAAGKASLLSWLDEKYVAAIAACDAGQVAGTLPTKAQLQAVFDPQS